MIMLAVFLINMSNFDFSKVWFREHVIHNNNWKLVSAMPVKQENGAELKVNPNWKSYDIRVQYTKHNYEVFEDFDSKVRQVTVAIVNDKWRAHYEH